MKLRNSFASIKSIADELNVPIAEENFSQSNVNIKIDKPSKSSGLRVRNLKKSMLNDNRLLKLKDRFIRRSKSTVCDFKRSVEENSNENNQNKENERPTFPSMIDLTVKSPTTTRNKVKMGTRVFSASYLNKSFDSLNENQAELTRVDSWGALCMNFSKRETFDETAEDEKEIETTKDKSEAYVIGKPSLVYLTPESFIKILFHRFEHQKRRQRKQFLSAERNNVAVTFAEIRRHIMYRRPGAVANLNCQGSGVLG